MFCDLGNRGDLRALVPETAAVRRAPQHADEPASGRIVPSARIAIGLTFIAPAALRSGVAKTDIQRGARAWAS